MAEEKKENTLRISDFDWSTMKENVAVNLVGSRGSGKSNVLMNFLKKKSKEYNFIIAFSPDLSERIMLKSFTKEGFIHSDYNAQVLETCLDIAENMNQKIKPCKMLILFCECLYHLKKCDVIERLFSKYNNYNISFVIMEQYNEGNNNEEGDDDEDNSNEEGNNNDCLVKYPKKKTQQQSEIQQETKQSKFTFDYIFSTKFYHSDNLKNFREKYYAFLKSEEFFDIYNAITESYNVIVLNKTISSEKVSEIIFRFQPTFVDKKN